MALFEELKSEVAEEYYRSNTIQFGQFRLSVHNDNPDLPLSPWYLHYPKEGEPGTERLPHVYQLVGAAFFELCRAKGVAPNKIAGVPKGALPLANAHAQHYDGFPNNLVTFGKVQHADGKTEFTGPEGEWEEGDELVIDEDHTSGGRNKRLIRTAAMSKGFVVNHMLTVVDREQGGVQNMAEIGVGLHAIMTATELLSHGVHNGHIQQATMDEIIEYKNSQQL
jgi:orotate phosphoribosyltransferase